MNKIVSIALAALTAAPLAWAQESDDETARAADETSAEAPEIAEAVKAAEKKSEVKWFYTIPLCRRVQGAGEVLKAGTTTWAPIEEGRFYPLGSSFRAKEKSTVIIAFGQTCLATIQDGASFSTRPQPLSVPSRTLVLTGGDVELSLPSNLSSNLMCVTTSGFTAKSLCGESKFSYKDTGDGYLADVRCVTGSLALDGRHYKIPLMRAADALRVRETHDSLETILYGTSGDYVVSLDAGERYVLESQDDGTLKEVAEAKTLDWHLSVSTRVQINRAVPRIGTRMSVAIMTFNSMSQMKNHFAYTEGRPEVNTGELVVEVTSDDKSDAAKRAAEATTDEAVDESELVEDTPADESSAESSDDTSSSDDEESSDDDLGDDDW